MEAEVPKRGPVEVLRGGVGTLWRLVRGAGGGTSRADPSRPLLSASEFQEELAILGLSGRRFDPRDYADALGEYLDISIAIHVIPDDYYPELSRHLAISGRLGELRYSEQLTLAAVFVPGSLPPLVLNLTILHELGHLAAGDLLIEQPDETGETTPGHMQQSEFATIATRRGRKLARGSPFAEEELREREANLRASYALFAGCLGDDSPYAHAMYSVL